MSTSKLARDKSKSCCNLADSSDEDSAVAVEKQKETQQDIAQRLWDDGKVKRKASKHNSEEMDQQNTFAIELVQHLAKKPPGGDEDISQPAAIDLLNADVFLGGLKGSCCLLSNILNHASAANAPLFGDTGLTKFVATCVGEDANNLFLPLNFT